MATIKSYTDIEQSKKLAEILPRESADMEWINSDGLGEPFPFVGRTNDDEALPCWSLVALLSVLDFPSLTQNKEDEWEVCVLDHKSDGYINVLADNPVDACYEMILKLHEFKML